MLSAFMAAVGTVLGRFVAFVAIVIVVVAFVVVLYWLGSN